MSIPEPWPDAGPKLSEDAIKGSTRISRVNQPWRAAVATAEVLVAVLLAFATWWAWGHGIVSIRIPAGGGSTDVVTRLIGSWLALSVAFATIAGLALLDSSRQAMLGLGTERRRKARRAETAGASTR